jgi:ribosome-associated protein
LNNLEITQIVAEALAAKKAQEMVILDLRGLTIIADAFVIVTGTSAPHLHALVDAVHAVAKTHGIRNMRAEGTEDSGWVLIDLHDVVVHLFNAEQREFYKLERLWADAERLPVPDEEQL